MIFDSIANTLTDCLPELAGVAYIAAEHEAPGMLPATANGMCDRGLCWGLRNVLIARGRWRGVGFATVIRDHADVDPWAVAIHEAAHFLNHRPDQHAEEKFASLSAESQQFLTTGLWQRDAAEDCAPVAPSRAGHELSFLRAVAHVRFRVEAVGQIHVSPLDLIPHANYAISPFADYYRAFESECLARFSDPIREILSSPFPAAATALWASDLFSNPL